MNTYFVFCAALAALVIRLHTCATAVADDPMDAKRAVAFCLDGVNNLSTALRSGQAEISGTFSSRYRTRPSRDLQGELTGFVAYDGKKVRFDISRPGWIVDGESLNEWRSGEPTKMIKGQLRKAFATDGSNITIWNSDQPLISIGSESELPDRRIAEHIDFRCPTLFDLYSVNQGWTLAHILSRFDTEFPDNVKCTINEGNWNITWTYKGTNDICRWILNVDTARGFTPTSYRCETKFPTLPDDWICEWENITRWTQISDIWVPIRSERHYYQNPASDMAESIVMDFKWSSVNQAISPDVFTYKSFNVPDHIAIQDSSGGEAVWIKPFPNSNYPTAREKSLFGIKMLLFLISMIGLGLLIITLLRSKKRVLRVRASN